MSIKTAYLSQLGRNYKVSDHFTLGEIASKDGADKVLYDTELLDFFEFVRLLLGGEGRATVGVNSLYRSPAHNRAVGGASNSTHTQGIAADVVFKQDGKRVPAKLICCLLQDFGIGGIAYINAYTVHVDNRKNGTYRGYEPDGFSNNVPNGDFYEFFNVTTAQVEALKVNKSINEKEEEAEMTQEKFNSMMNVWISQQAEKEPSGWSAEARKWAEENNIIAGTGAGYSYLSYCTREQMVQFLYNLYQEFIAKMGGDSSPAVLDAMIKALEGLKK